MLWGLAGAGGSHGQISLTIMTAYGTLVSHSGFLYGTLEKSELHEVGAWRHRSFVGALLGLGHNTFELSALRMKMEAPRTELYLLIPEP